MCTLPHRHDEGTHVLRGWSYVVTVITDFVPHLLTVKKGEWRKGGGALEYGFAFPKN